MLASNSCISKALHQTNDSNDSEIFWSKFAGFDQNCPATRGQMFNAYILPPPGHVPLQRRCSPMFTRIQSQTVLSSCRSISATELLSAEICRCFQMNWSWRFSHDSCTRKWLVHPQLMQRSSSKRSGSVFLLGVSNTLGMACSWKWMESLSGVRFDFPKLIQIDALRSYTWFLQTLFGSNEAGLDVFSNHFEGKSSPMFVWPIHDKVCCSEQCGFKYLIARGFASTHGQEDVEKIWQIFERNLLHTKTGALANVVRCTQ